jgi:hypothetical protein
MDGYRYWVERHRLAVWLEDEKTKAAALPEAQRLELTLAAEREFRRRLDALYGQAQSEFRTPSSEPAKS